MESANLQYASLLSAGHNHVKPTIFDIVAQENMQSLFRTSFNHLFKWLIHAEHSPRLSPIRDALYLSLHGLIEMVYLKAYDGLFSEYFYGMKRLNLTSNWKRILSILLSVVLPYLKAKLDEFYEDLERTTDISQLNSGSNNNSNVFTKSKLIIKKFLLKFYPYLHLIWHLTFLYFRFKFMINMSDYSSPLLQMLGVRLVYDSDSNNDSDNESPSFLIRLLQSSNKLFPSLIYFVQFYQWYEEYTENNSYETSDFSLAKHLYKSEEIGDDGAAVVIPPPRLPDKLLNSKAYTSLAAANLCPICTKKRTNECVLSVSGFVFCYPCIFKFIKEHSRCPLTKFPCTVKNIVRIYDS